MNTWSPFIDNCNIADQDGKRVEKILHNRFIGRIRFYDEETEKYGYSKKIFKWQNMCENSIAAEREILFYPSFVSEKGRKSLAESMKQCNIRQYYFGPSGYSEPRVHVFLHSYVCEKSTCGQIQGNIDHSNPGYHYHGVKLKAEPLSSATQIESFAQDLAEKYSLPDKKWNIGVDVVVYRDGKDRMGWHADDTQGEQIVLCVVVECDIARPLKVRSKFKNGKKSTFTRR